MRTVVLIILLLFITEWTTCTQEEHASTSKSKKRKIQNRRRRVLSKSPNAKQLMTKPLTTPIPEGLMPVFNADDAKVHVLQTILGVNEQAPTYNILPVKKGHCTVNGMVMFENAVWSPKPCITCMCSNGKEICDEIICPILTCPITLTHEGECCPVCSNTVPNTILLENVPEFSGDSSEPNNLNDLVILKAPKTQEDMDELFKTEEEKNSKREKLEAKKLKQKKKKEDQKRQSEEKRKKQKAREKEKESEEKRKAHEEEKVRKKEEQREREEEMKRIEEKKREELNALQRLQKEKEEQEKYEEDDDEEGDDDEEEEYILRGDVFRISPRFPGSRQSAVIHHPPLPSGCFISETTVSCSNAKLKQIPAISDPDVKSIELTDNAITAIPKEAFNGMPNLERIDLTRNSLTSNGIDSQAFKSLKKLNRLYLDGNLLNHMLTELPSSLEELKLNDNKLEGLKRHSMEDLTNLITLEMEGNQLSEGNVSPLAFKPLKHLAYLRLGKNKFRTIPQGLPVSIEELHLESNEIEEIVETSFNHTKNLHTVVLRHNKLEESRIDPLTWIFHKNLESIDLSYNKLYQVPSYLPKSLQHLVLVGNQIERIPGYVFAHLNPGLEYLYLSFNKLDNDGIDTASFYGAYHSLREMFLDHNGLQNVPTGIEYMTDLHILRLNNNKIRSVSPYCICSAEEEGDSSLEELHLENNLINTREISPYVFFCIRSYSSVILKPQKVK
ncbi:hypothetical protein XELAEV_18023759mg [Xenopus laevis]|uniref:VWFC domain-containing protein n=1 Tax=Xenopus laevis TaxID=8355 RepID=A0A974D5L5_XENLA|nr:hypothetical protein XELAEV_18023759mg [Xenopus laevis]